jgi:hypothetical protein
VKTPSDALSDRVHELVQLREQHGPILSTTGTRAAIESRPARLDRLAAALRESASGVQELAASQRSGVR